MIDTHCHIIPQFGYNNPNETILNAKKAGVTKMICIGCDFDDIEQTLPLVEQYPDVIYSAIGLHPEIVKEETDIKSNWEKFEKIFLENQEKIFAVGECGLDYHYSDNKIIHSKQRELFELHIQLCLKHNKPLIIHTRDAWEDTFEILDKYYKNVGARSSRPGGDTQPLQQELNLKSGIVHSFTGGIEEARKSIELGFKLGINGIVTFKTKNLDSLRDAVKYAGKENIVFETDSPFLSPEPYRSKTNEPARIKEISEYVDSLF